MNTPNPTVHVTVMGPIPADPVGHLSARAADGLDAVEVNLRFGPGGTRKVLGLLARVCIEVLVRSREITPVVPPEHEAVSREMESGRWNRG
jgi:hypothetical protein